MPAISLDIVILNYNGYKDTIDCVESLFGNWREGCRVIIVDNCSSDDSISQLRAWAEGHSPPVRLIFGDRAERTSDDSGMSSGQPEVTLLRAPSNGGFSAGNNIGIRCALQRGAGWILLLNNDTVVEPDALEGLLKGAEGASAGLAGPSIYEYGQPATPSYLGGKFRWWGDKHLTSLPASLSDAGGCIETDWITGCCLLVRRDVFARIGLFDENSFLYCEDADFCRRAAKAGFKRILIPRAKIYHKVGATVGFGSALARYHFTRSRVYFNAKHYPMVPRAAFVFIFSLVWCLKCPSWFLRGRADLIRATWHGLRDGLLLGRRAKVTVRVDSGHYVS